MVQMPRPTRHNKRFKNKTGNTKYPTETLITYFRWLDTLCINYKYFFMYADRNSGDHWANHHALTVSAVILNIFTELKQRCAVEDGGTSISEEARVKTETSARRMWAAGQAPLELIKGLLPALFKRFYVNGVEWWWTASWTQFLGQNENAAQKEFFLPEFPLTPISWDQLTRDDKAN